MRLPDSNLLEGHSFIRDLLEGHSFIRELHKHRGFIGGRIWCHQPDCLVRRALTSVEITEVTSAAIIVVTSIDNTEVTLVEIIVVTSIGSTEVTSVDNTTVRLDWIELKFALNYHCIPSSNCEVKIAGM